MNKTFFRLAFLACLSATGCASPFQMFAKKPQPFDEYLAQRRADEQKRVPSSGATTASTDVTNLLNKGHAAFQQGNLIEAQTQYLAVIQKQPQNGTANHRLAVIADRHQDFNSAEHYYRAALAANSRDPNLLNDAGYSLLLQSRFAEAEQYLQAALQQNPNYTNAINNMGIVHAKRGQADQALAMFRRTGSESEAQAKLARMMPAAPAGQMVADNAWGSSANVPTNSQPGANSPAWTNPNQGGQFANSTPPSATANPNWPPRNMPANQQIESGPSAVAQGSLGLPPNVNSGDISEATRQLREQMDRAKQQAVAERHAHDLAEQARLEAARRQVHEEELASSRVQQASGIQRNNDRWSPGAAPPAYPIENRNPQTAQPNWPAGQTPRMPQPNDPGVQLTPGRVPNTNSMPNATPYQGTMPNATPYQGSMPNTVSPPQNNAASSPLDALPTWPPTDSLPTYSAPRGDRSAANAPMPGGSAAFAGDDQARMASRMGMNVGPGNLFSIAPNSANATPQGRPNPNSADSNLPPNSTNGLNYGTPTLNPPTNWGPNPNTEHRLDLIDQYNANPPGNWGPNSNSPPPSSGIPNDASGPSLNEPPEGSFGPGGFSTSRNGSTTLPESPSRYALQGQVPPSEQYQTPNTFAPAASPNGINTRPASYAPQRGTPAGHPANESLNSGRDPNRAGSRAPAPNRTNGGDRWEQGADQNINSATRSAPTAQGFITGPAGENSLTEYERMIQAHNTEANFIRQQIDTQRQLPGAETYYRNRLAGQ